MMKVKIHNNKDLIEFELKLEADEDGDIFLKAVNKDGDEISDGNLLYIDIRKGDIKLSPKINPKLGFKVDEKGCIEIAKPMASPFERMIMANLQPQENKDTN